MRADKAPYYAGMKNTRPFAHLKRADWVSLQMSLILPKAQYSTATWTTQDHNEAMALVKN